MVPFCTTFGVMIFITLRGRVESSGVRTGSLRPVPPTGWFQNQNLESSTKTFLWTSLNPLTLVYSRGERPFTEYKVLPWPQTSFHPCPRGLGGRETQRVPLNRIQLDSETPSSELVYMEVVLEVPQSFDKLVTFNKRKEKFFRKRTKWTEENCLFLWLWRTIPLSGQKWTIHPFGQKLKDQDTLGKKKTKGIGWERTLWFDSMVNRWDQEWLLKDSKNKWRNKTKGSGHGSSRYLYITDEWHIRCPSISHLCTIVNQALCATVS